MTSKMISLSIYSTVTVKIVDSIMIVAKITSIQIPLSITILLNAILYSTTTNCLSSCSSHNFDYLDFIYNYLHWIGNYLHMEIDSYFGLTGSYFDLIDSYLHKETE